MINAYDGSVYYHYPVAYKPSGFRQDVGDSENKTGCTVLVFPTDKIRQRFLQTLNKNGKTRVIPIDMTDIITYTHESYFVFGQVVVPRSEWNNRENDYYLDYLWKYLKRWNETGKWK